MKRRRVLQILAVGTSVGLVSAGSLWLHGRPAPVADMPDLDAALHWIDALAHDRTRSLTA